jgi:hypothetical protein
LWMRGSHDLMPVGRMIVKIHHYRGYVLVAECESK